MEPQWLDWGKRLQALAQTGLTFAQNEFDRERYASVQRVAAEILARGSGLSTDHLLTLFGAEEGYATPKVDVRGVVFREGALLLVRERADGGWTLPGGWADVCESPAENTAREVFEETGYVVRATKLLAAYDRSRHPHQPPALHHIYKLFFLCELLGGEPTDSHETDAPSFFREEEVPSLSISRVTPGQIARMFQHLRDPDLPTDFD